MIKKCKCSHKFQDEKYGDKNRVHNKMAKDPKKPQEYRCTVCWSITT